MTKRLALAVSLLISSAHGMASTESTSAQWLTEFGASGAMSLDPWPESVDLSRNSSGQAFLDVSRPYGRRTVIRLDAKGDPEWAISNYRYGHSDLAHLRDGSVLVIANEVSLYSPSGAFVWSAYIPTKYDDILRIVEVNNEIYASAGGTAEFIHKIDRFTGLVIETLQSEPFYPDCSPSAMRSVGENTIYLASSCANRISKISTNPLRFDWSKIAGMSISAIDADTSGLFVSGWTNTNDSWHAATRKLATANGETLWSRDQATPNILDTRLDIDGHLLIRRESTIEKIHSATGLRIWQHQTADRITALDTSAAGIFLSLDSPSSPSISGGKAASIDRNTGDALWTAPLPPPASFEKSATHSIAVTDNRLVASGTTCNGPQANPLCRIALWSMSTDGTNQTSATPMIKLSSAGNAVLTKSDVTLAAALESGPSGPQITAKKIRNSDGSIVWTSTHRVPLGELPANIDTAWIQEAGDGDAVILYSNPPRESTPNSSGGAILKLNGASGALRWQKALLDPASSYTDIKAYDFTSDEEGNIFASICVFEVVESWGSPPPAGNHERYIVKLASATGQQQSRLDFNPSSGGTCWPPILRSIANDLLLDELPAPSDQYALSRVNGSTGQIVWQRSDVRSHIHLIDANTAYASTVGEPSIKIIGINLDDGSTRWMTKYSDPRDSFAHVGNILLDSQGGLLIGSRRDAVIDSDNPPNRGMLLRLDKTNGELLWAHRFEQTPNRSVSVLQPAVEQSGIVYSRQYARASNENLGYFLLANSLITGEFLGAQFLNYQTQKQGHLPQDSPLSVVGSANDAGLIIAAHHRAPSAPHQFRVAKFNQPSPVAGGALKVELSVVASGSLGEAHFIFDTINHGTITAHDVLATLSFPGNAIISNVECDVSGAPCTSQATQGFVEHKLDLPAGQRLRLSGTLTIRDQRMSSATLHANAYGGFGFSEMDLRDNSTSSSVNLSLFRNGFD